MSRFGGVRPRSRRLVRRDTTARTLPRRIHVAPHGFAREDLLAGLHQRKISEAWISAETERQLGAGHDPMLLSGLALAGANPRAGGGKDDGILTALDASYLDLDGVDLVTLSACETARGVPSLVLSLDTRPHLTPADRPRS